MEMSGQLHAPAALICVPIVQEAGWVQSWSGRNGEKSLLIKEKLKKILHKVYTGYFT